MLNENPERRRIFEEVGEVEFMTEFFRFFGPHRALQLIGWAVVWGVRGIENTPEFREQLKAQGISRSTAYTAAMDFRRFKEWVEYRVGHPITDEELMRDLQVGAIEAGKDVVPES